MAEWGPTILWVLTALLAVALGFFVFGCRAGACNADTWSMPAWWVCFALTGLFGVVVFVLRIRRDMALATTIAAAAVLTVSAIVAAGGVEAWTRWFGL